MQQLTADAIVVGGGPGGLAAAHALARVGCSKVLVFERSRASLQSKRGAGLGLDINGMKALQAIKPELLQRVTGMAAFLATNRVLRPDGSLVQEVPMGTGSREEYAARGYRTPCLLGWSELVASLADELPADSVTLRTGLAFERYEQQPGSSTVTAFFTYPAGDAGAGAGLAVTAPLLVASDGYFSRTRRQCLNDGPPEWGNTLVWRARLPAADAAAAGLPELADGTRSVFVQDVGRFLFSYPISSGDVVWTLGCSDEKLQEVELDPTAVQQQLRASATTSTSTASTTSTSTDYTALQTQGFCPQEVAAGEAAKARCLQALTGMWAPLLSLVAATPASALVEHGVYNRPASSLAAGSFGAGRIAIIGDAAHPLRPTGQGLNQTLEDAHGLGAAVAAAGGGAALAAAGRGDAAAGAALERQLQAFREARAERVRPVVAFTSASGRAAYAAKKTLSDEKAAAVASLGMDTPEMSAEQFSNYCCDIELRLLAELAAEGCATNRQQAAAAVAVSV